MKLFAAAAALALLTGMAGLGGGAVVDARKCPPDPSPTFAGAPDFVFLLDGQAIDQVQFDHLDKRSFESVDIVCAKELHEVFGVKAKMSGVVAFTAPGPSTALRASLQSIAPLQEKHLREHGAFTTDLSRLGWKDETGLITIDLEVDPDGSRWIATGRHRYRLGYVAHELGERP